MNYYSSFNTAMFKIGRGNNYAILAQKLPSLHFFNLAAHQNIGRSENKKLVIFDVERTGATDNLMRSVFLLGHILDMMTAYLLCHIPFKALAVGIFAFGCFFNNLFYQSHAHLIKYKAFRRGISHTSCYPAKTTP